MDEKLEDDVNNDFQQKHNKIVENFEKEKTKLEKKIELLIEQNNMLETKLYNKFLMNNIIISNEIQINF